MSIFEENNCSCPSGVTGNAVEPVAGARRSGPAVPPPGVRDSSSRPPGHPEAGKSRWSGQANPGCGALPRRILPIIPAILCLAALFFFCAHPTRALAEGINIPAVHLNLDGANGPKQVSGALEIILLLTVLSLAPALLILMTSFTRFAVVFSFLRYALGTQQSPPNQVIIGLALFLTFFVMRPVWQQIDRQALVPYEQHTISSTQFIQRGIAPLKDFMLRQTNEQDLALFVSMSQDTKPKNAQSLSVWTVIPAFVISELKTAFQIGFMLYVPFIIVDMVVASILLSMGMMMLPPVMISLPFKLMLFIMVNGWYLLIGSLVKSFH